MSFKDLLYKNLRPSSSGAHYEKIKAEFYSSLTDLASAFNVYKQGARIDLYIRKLMDADYTIGELQKCIDHCMTNCKAFPNYPEIIAIISNYSNKHDEDREQHDVKFETQAKQLRTDTDEWTRLFIERHSKKKLERYLMLYCRCVFGSSSFGKYGFSFNMFSPIFFQDFKAAKSLYKAIQQGKKHERERNRK